MADFDRDAFEERAAIMEFDGGLSRFRAESAAADAQGFSRWEAIGDVAQRLVSKARDQREEMDGAQRKDDVSRVQPSQEEENGPVPECDGN